MVSSFANRALSLLSSRFKQTRLQTDNSPSALSMSDDLLTQQHEQLEFGHFSSITEQTAFALLENSIIKMSPDSSNGKTQLPQFFQRLTEQFGSKRIHQAEALIGFCYEFGIGTSVDFSKAFFHYLEASNQKNGLGCARLAFLLKYGRPGINIDRDAAAHYATLLKASSITSAAPEDSALSSPASRISGKLKNYFGIQWITRAAKKGNSSAQYCLGTCYHDGFGVQSDKTKACSWYRKSANQGNPRGQAMLGYCYGEGFGIDKSDKQALYWYRKAAEKGDPIAYYNIGFCYEDGLGVEKNPRLAFEWYTKAAELGNHFAQNSLGYCFEDGVGTEKNSEMAVYWYSKASEQGYCLAQCNLGYCYQYGIGVDKNEQKATELYKVAASRGHSRAQHNLGFCYQNGIGI